MARNGAQMVEQTNLCKFLYHMHVRYSSCYYTSGLLCACSHHLKKAHKLTPDTLKLQNRNYLEKSMDNARNTISVFLRWDVQLALTG